MLNLMLQSLVFQDNEILRILVKKNETDDQQFVHLFFEVLN